MLHASPKAMAIQSHNEAGTSNRPNYQEGQTMACPSSFSKPAEAVLQIYGLALKALPHFPYDCDSLEDFLESLIA
jgi:hypothetical protein